VVVAEEAAVVVAVVRVVVEAEVAAVERNRHHRGKSRRGVALLEVLLSLFLSVTVLAAIGMAINLHFKMLDVRRTSLEEIQVIRAVTKRITDDIRMVVQPNEPDLSGLETTFANAMQAAQAQAQAAAASGPTILGAGGVQGGNQAGGGQGLQAGVTGQAQGGARTGQPVAVQPNTGVGKALPAAPTAPAAQSGGKAMAVSAGSGSGGASSGGGGGGMSSGGASSAGGSAGPQASADPTAAAATTTTAAATVQLIGSMSELRFDISRLPRVDQYKGMMSAKGEPSAVDLPSDVKTIVYFLRSETSAATYTGNPSAPGGDPSTDGIGRGLMRAEMDRAVTTYAENSGGQSIYDNAQLIADEVVGLGFEYFDGVEWPTEWDSTTQGLPRAIRVWLSLKPTYGMSEKELSQAAAGKETPPTDFYFVINLPTAPLVATPPETETTDATGAASTTSSAGATGTTP
jgi:hypothetical protein